MSLAAPEPAAPDDPSLPLDPFAHWPGAASRIAGLGGTQPAVDPRAAFHTAFHAPAPGPIQFDLHVSGLAATRGMLTLIVHTIDAGGATALAKIVHVALADLAAAGGRYRLTFDATGAGLALAGYVFDETDATATHLALTQGPRRDGSPLAARLAIARDAIFAPRRTGRLAGLTRHGPATIADPVSQMCTAAQMDEPLYAEWLARMGQSHHRHRKQWEFVYIVQALAHHGMLRPGHRGLGFGVGVEPLPALFAAMGIATVATDLAADDARAAAWSLTHQHGKALDDLRNPAICPDAAFDALVRFEPADMTAIPAHLRGFDFCWSSCAFEHLGSIGAGLTFVRRSLDTLRPGGLAVHTTELNLVSNARTSLRGETVLFRRMDFERLALRLAAEGHEVMPLNWDIGTHQDDRFVDAPPYSTDVHLKVALARYATTSFGLIVRKAA
ncbi:MAG: class I SAM-dependent methyltransferase [Sphingomonas fennica]